MSAIQAVLFDLDGTLVDSAPDLGGAANDLRERHGLAPLPVAQYRAYCGSGARGMLRVGFGIGTEHPDYEPLKAEFLAIYGQRLLRETRLFHDTLATVSALRRAGLPWGVVTNKTLGLARPLCLGLGLEAQTVVGGDCTPHRKPHPAPLLEAARRLGVSPAACLYVGDDPRDITAGRAAGMTTAAAVWGYLGPDSPPARWGADHLLPELGAVLKLLALA